VICSMHAFASGQRTLPTPELFVLEGLSVRVRSFLVGRAVIAKGGEFVTGATRSEVITETSGCVADALKSNAAENAVREVRGVKIECQAFTRDGGGGGVTIYRRFGPDPIRPEISDTAPDRWRALIHFSICVAPRRHDKF
jgi:hypothetical protein